jgi:nucleotide-binding universal stress UspA family protein
MKPIVVATDGSPGAECAVEKAVLLAKALGEPLTVLAVWQVPTSTFAYGQVAWTPELAAAEQERAERAAASAAATAADANVNVDIVVRQGMPIDQILRLADERDAELIVLGSHGWGAIKRMWFGSVSTRVLHEAHRPVLVVPSDPAVVKSAVAA